MAPSGSSFDRSERWALEADREDPLAGYRERFAFPDNDPIYFCGNSLGLMPRAVPLAMQRDLDAWAAMGVEGHFKDEGPWFAYHELVRDSLATLVDAHPDEVVAMNSLTANLHFLLVSLYQPTPQRHAILMGPTAFPSDTYVAQTQLRAHGFNDDAVLVPESADEASFEALIDERGDEIALMLLGGVNYYTGQLYDMPRLTAAAQARGIRVILDLAHAAGNVPLALHDWNVDAAVWCSYKYLNSGPGAIGAAFVHRRHAGNLDLPRFGGWWGNDPATRFRMHLEKSFIPVASADAWQLSNPSVFSTVPLRCSLDLFDEVGMGPLREKSLKLTAYLEQWIDEAALPGSKLLTPRDPERRGAQLSLFFEEQLADAMFERLKAAGLIADFRKPGVIRMAPAPLYNSFHDVWRLGQALTESR